MAKAAQEAAEPPSIEELLKDSDWDARLEEARTRRKAVLAARQAQTDADAASAAPVSVAEPLPAQITNKAKAAEPVAPPPQRYPLMPLAFGMAVGVAVGLAAGVGFFLGAGSMPRVADQVGKALPSAPLSAGPKPAQLGALATAPSADGRLAQMFARKEVAMTRLPVPQIAPVVQASRAVLPLLQPAPPRLDGPVDPGAVRLRVTGPDLRESAPLAVAVAALQATGFAVPEPTPALALPEAPELRFFHSADADAAQAAGYLAGVPVRDFSSFRPSPPRGTLELWAGRG